MLAKQLTLSAALIIWCMPSGLQDPDMRSRALQAIEAGNSNGVPQPYLLRYAAHDGDGEQDAVIGAVYTPYLRVALAAAERAKSQAALSLPEAEAILKDNFFYAALRWREQDQGTFGSAPIQVVAVPRNSGYFNEAVGIAPIWIAPGIRAVSILGREFSWDDGVIVAFPHALFSPDYDFVIFKSIIDPASGSARRQHGRARIARADYARWIW